MAQVVKIFSSATVGAATAKLLNISSGVVVATAASATLTGGLWYACSFSGVTLGTYAFCLYDGGTERAGMLVTIDAANGVWGDLVDSTTEILTALEEIQGKTDLITTYVPIVSAVSADGTIDEIIIGDDYLDANGRAFQWTVEAVEGVAIGDASCTFGAQSEEYSFLVDGTVTDAGAGNWLLSFDLLRTDTAPCKPGKYEWSVQVNDADDNEITKVRSRTTKTRLVQKQT